MEGFDALYPFHGDTWELHQSIRLLRKFTNVKNIYVVGDDPGLDVIHVPFVQQDAKEINIWKKVLAGCFSGISERFLFINDDHFITGPTEFPLVYGDMPDECSQQYFNAMGRTMQRLVDLGKNDLYFDIHYPFFVEKSMFLECFQAFNDGKEYIFKSAYCNFHGLEGDFCDDKKIKFLGNAAEYKAFIADTWCFSTELLTEPLKNMILQM